MPANFNDLRLAEGIVLMPHPLAKQARAEFHRGERDGPAPRLRRQEGARAGHRRRLRHRAKPRARVTLMLNGREVETQAGRSAGERPRHGRVPVAGAALRPQQGRSADRFRRQLPADDTYLLLASSAPTRATRCSSTSGTDQRALLYFRAALEAPGNRVRIRDRCR